jgi:hypothetical protein
MLVLFFPKTKRSFLFIDVVIKQKNPIWMKTKRIFSRAGKAHKELQSKVRQTIEDKQVKQFFLFFSFRKFSFFF